MFSKRMKLVTVALSAILTAPAMMGAVTYRNSVRILDEGDHAKTILTQSSDPRVILEEAGIELGQYDTIEFVERAERVYHLKIDRAFDVAFDDGGTSRTVEMVEGETVADLLKKAGVTLGADDVITPALTETVTPETQVVLQRITYQTQTVNETIPYGSKLYIKSSDGSFVYGYAVAADTGIALMDGRVTVDLYFDTYLESCLFGAKTMDIYVLE